MKAGWRHRVAGLVLALLLTLGGSGVCPGQLQLGALSKVKGVSYPYFVTAGQGKTNRLKTLVTGAEAQPRLSGQVSIKELKIENYRDDGQVDLVIRTSECLFEITTRTAWSTNRLEVVSGNGQYTIQGQGFYWQQTNNLLIISNRTETTLRRELVTPLATPTNPATALPSIPKGSSNAVVRVMANRCVYLSQSNLLFYTGDVLADDPQLELRCQRLQIRFSETRQLQELLAHDQVSLVNKQDQSRATGGQARYLFVPGEEVFSLAETPVWRDPLGTQELRADLFHFDLQTRTLHAETNAIMKLPRGRFAQADLPFARVNSRGPVRQTPAAESNQVVEITADRITVLLPSTNRPTRQVTAQDHVVILSPADQSRTTADRATYAEADGRLSLDGHAFWQSEKMTVKADGMNVDRTNQVFATRGNTWLRLPVSTLGGLGGVPSPSAAPAETNQFLEIVCRDLDYFTNRLVLQGKVRGEFFEGPTLRGTLEGEEATLALGERLDSITVRQNVLVDQRPFLRTNGTLVSGWLACQTLVATMNTNGQVSWAVAEGQVAARQTEHRPNWKAPHITDLTCGKATATAVPNTNRLEQLVAERQVVMSQDDKIGRGDRAIYDGLAETLELTEHPSITTAQGAIREAEALLYDLRQEKVKSQGPVLIQGTWSPPTNRAPVRMPKRH